MAETLVEEKICEACGADVRAGSLFCYNCGGPLALDLKESSASAVKVSDAWLKSDLAGDSDLKTTRLDRTAIKEDKTTVGEIADEVKPIKMTEAVAEKPEPQLKSAATMRRKAKSFQRKATEIVWEEPENGPNKWFPVVAIFLILLVVGIFYLAMYLR